MSSIAQRESVIGPVEASPSHRTRPSGALIIADLLALLGVLLVGISLFRNGWVHARLVFASQGLAAGRICPSCWDPCESGTGTDRRQGDRRSAPTDIVAVWGTRLSMGLRATHGSPTVLILTALAFSRVRVAAQSGALLACAGAVSAMVAALLHIHQQSASLPQQIAQAVLNSSVGNRVLDLTTGKPTLEVGIGWPLYAGAAGVGLVVLGVLLGLVFTVIQASRGTRS